MPRSPGVPITVADAAVVRGAGDGDIEYPGVVQIRHIAPWLAAVSVGACTRADDPKPDDATPAPQARDKPKPLEPVKPEDSPCKETQNGLATVWNEARAEKVRTAFAATGMPFSPDAATATVAALDAYAEAWTEQALDACEATEIRGEATEQVYALRRACLGDRKAYLDAFATALTGADARVVEEAPRAATELADVEECGQLEALIALDPPDAGIAQQVDAIRHDVSKARALVSLGQPSNAESIASKAFERAGAIDYPPLRADARYVRGLARMASDVHAAEDDLQEAAWLAASSKHDRVAAAAAVALVENVGSRMGKPEDGLAWARHAEAALRRVTRKQLDAELLYWKGRLQLTEGRAEEAVRDLSEANELCDQLGMRLAGAEASIALGDAYLALSKPDDAARVMRAALTTIEADAGASHPLAAVARIGLARGEQARGSTEEATAELTEAQRIIEDVYGTTSIEPLRLRSDLAEGWRAAGRTEDAHAIYEAMLESFGKEEGHELAAALVRFRMARLDEAAGKHAEAIALLEAAQSAPLLDGVVSADLTMALADAVREGDPKRAAELQKQAEVEYGKARQPAGTPEDRERRLYARPL